MKRGVVGRMKELWKVDGRGCGGAGEEEKRCEGGVGLARLKLLLIMKNSNYCLSQLRDSSLQIIREEKSL